MHLCSLLVPPYTRDAHDFMPPSNIREQTHSQDPRLVAFINWVAQTEHLPMLEAFVYDVQQPLDEKKYKAEFDVVVCDPPDTIEAFSLWISRASLALRGINSVMYLGLTSVEASITKWYRYQRLALDARFAISDIRRKFTRYANNPKQANVTYAFQALNLSLSVRARGFCVFPRNFHSLARRNFGLDHVLILLMFSLVGVETLTV
jgi:hypothetical protein